MTDVHRLRAMVRDEQGEFATMLRGLIAERRTPTSLSIGWSVRDVVIPVANESHATARAHPPTITTDTQARAKMR